MMATNVFFEFPCFIERWLVNKNLNNNNNTNTNNKNVNQQFFVNKNDIIGHVRLDNNTITSFRAPVSGYLIILIKENIRVRKGLNVAAIHPHPININDHQPQQLQPQQLQS